MSVIPAASIRDINLDRIRELFPQEAEEISILGKMMDSGSESDEDFLRLCQLLNDVGEKAKSEELLRANAVEGDAVYNLYIRLHGLEAEKLFSQAIEVFSHQFGVELQRKRSSRYLHLVCACEPGVLSNSLPVKLRELFSGHCEVSFMYFSDTEIVADVDKLTEGQDSLDNEPVSCLSQPFLFRNGEWTPQ